MTPYEPIQAYRCKFSHRLAPSVEEALDEDIETACFRVCGLTPSMLQGTIKALLEKDDHYTDVHRALLFLGEIVRKRADEIAARLAER